MNRTGNDLRKVFLRLKEAGETVTKIADILGVSRQTIYKWQKLDKDKLLTEPSGNTRKPVEELMQFKQYIRENPSAFNREISKVFNRSKSTIHRWRQKLNITRKQFRTTYREADEELKKTS